MPKGAVLRPTHVRVDERGTLREILNEGRWESLLCGEMRSGAVMGRHYHKLTDVFFHLTAGRATVVQVDVQTDEQWQTSFAAGEGIRLQRNVAHAIRFDEDSAFVMMKSRRYDPADADTYEYRVPL